MNIQRLIETHNTYEEPHDWSEQAKEALGQLQNALEQETTMLRQQQVEIEELKEKDLRKSMAIRSLNTQLKKALQYKTFSNMAHKNPVKTLEKIGAILRKAQEK